MPDKKKKTRLTDEIGQVPSPDIKQQRSEAYLDVDDSPRSSVSKEKKKGYGSIGGYATFGDSETKSLGRAMQEQKTKEVAQEILERMKKRNSKK